MDNKILLDYLLNVLREPIQSYLKSHRIDALAKVAEATKERKDGEIGHSAERIYYRALTYLEMELLSVASIIALLKTVMFGIQQ